MPVLLLLRHAKSDWGDPALGDFDRPLNRRGREAAPRMGREIAARGWTPDRALVSPAARARQTWDLAAGQLPHAVETAFDCRLYLAALETLLAALRSLEGEPETVILVGHNPGMEELAGSLAGPGSDRAALKRLRGKFPTAALARFEFAGGWAALAPGAARLTDFLPVKDLIG